MAVKNRLIPFGMLPGSWGLAGKTRERAEAEYTLDGEDLELRMAEIDIIDGDILETTQVEIKFKYESITEKDHDYAIAAIRGDEGTLLGVKHKHKEISDAEFCKGMASIRDEPWVDYKEIEIDKQTGAVVSFELDWNDKFIEVIRNDGHVAPTDEDCVDLWLTEMSKNIALEELHGTGYFDDDAEESYDLKKRRLDDGKSEYS